MMTGGPNDKLGQLANPPMWRLSGKRLNGCRPSEANLDYLRRIAFAVGANDEPPEEPIWGTWHWTWTEEGERKDEGAS